MRALWIPLLVAVFFAGVCQPLSVGEQTFLSDLIALLPVLPTGWSRTDFSEVCTSWYGVGCNGYQNIIDFRFELDPEDMVPGNIPESIGNMTSLQVLKLSELRGNGTLTSAICNLHQLNYIRISNAKLTGRLPECINGTNFPVLNTAVFSANLLSGPFPEQLITIPTLKVIVLGSNEFTGTLPAAITTLSNLTYFAVSKNSFSGSIPASFADLPNIQFLHFGNNNFSCPISDFYNKLLARPALLLSAINHNFFDINPEKNTICGDIHAPFDNKVRILPVLERDVRPVSDAKFVVREEKLQLEAAGTKLILYPVFSDGTVRRDEFIALDFSAWVNQVTGTTDYYENGLSLEQYTVPPFVDIIPEEARRRYSFLTTLENGAKMSATIQFGALESNVGVKIGMEISNWTLVPGPPGVDEKYIDATLFLQISIKTNHSSVDQPMKCPGEVFEEGAVEFPCYGPHSNISLFLQQQLETGGIAIGFTVESDAIVGNCLLSGSFYLDDSTDALQTDYVRPTPLLLPFGDMTHVSSFGIEGYTNPQYETQAISVAANFFFPHWQKKLFWDPDLSILLKYDRTTPSGGQAPESEVVGIAVGVSVGAVAVGAALTVGLAVYFKKRKYSRAASRIQKKVASAMTPKHKVSAPAPTVETNKWTEARSSKTGLVNEKDH